METKHYIFDKDINDSINLYINDRTDKNHMAYNKHEALGKFIELLSATFEHMKPNESFYIDVKRD